MALAVFTNNATSLLAGNISSGDGSLSVTSTEGALFPAPTGGDWFPLVVVDGAGNIEIMKATARSGDVITVTRGQEGTSARAWSAGARVDCRLTVAALAAAFQGLDADLTAIAALTTTPYGRSVLETANAAALRTLAGLVIGTDVQAFAADLATLAGLSPTNDDLLQRKSGAWANRTIAQVETDFGAAMVPVGAILPFAGTSAPTNYLFCYGQAVSRTTYSALFTALGTTYGVGDGSTTFNLPDLRGRVAAGKDDMGGTSANRLTDQTGGLDGDVLGDTGGEETHQLSTAEMPLHGHPYRRSFSTDGNTASGGFVQFNNANQHNPAAFTGTPSATTGEQIGGTGGDGAHNNVQPTMILNYVIRAL